MRQQYAHDQIAKKKKVESTGAEPMTSPVRDDRRRTRKPLRHGLLFFFFGCLTLVLSDTNRKPGNSTMKHHQLLAGCMLKIWHV